MDLNPDTGAFCVVGHTFTRKKKVVLFVALQFIKTRNIESGEANISMINKSYIARR